MSLKEWSERVTLTQKLAASAVALGALLWGAIVSADDVIKSAKKVPTLEELVRQNSHQIELLRQSHEQSKEQTDILIDLLREQRSMALPPQPTDAP